MSVFRKPKLSDAIRPAVPATRASRRAGLSPATHAEQQREAQENAGAHGAVPSARDRMVGNGRGNKQSGRQKTI